MRWFRTITETPKLPELASDERIVLFSSDPRQPDIFIKISEAAMILKILELDDADRQNIKEIIRNLIVQRF